MDLSSQRLKELVDYDPETGVFTRKVTTAATARVGDIAGTKRRDGYTQIQVAGKPYLAHRLAWLYMTGNWPAEEVDHANGVREDNRFANLRAASRQENGSNLRKPKANNTSGFLGVVWSKQKNKWAAQITVNRKNRVLGHFDDPAMAHQEYVKAKRAAHPFCTI